MPTPRPSTDIGRTLVTGASGNVGSGVLRLLADQGLPVRALTRRQSQVEAFQARGIEAARGGFEDPESLRRALTGCDQLFLLPPPGPDQLEHHRRALDAAAAVGVRRVVQLSTLDARHGSAIPWAAAHAYGDDNLRAGGLDWTILQPSAFMQNLLLIASGIRRGVLPQTSGLGATGWIDVADIAAVAAAVLTQDGHDGRAYKLTGSAALSMPEIAAILSRTTGRRVRYLHLPGPAFRLALRAGGTSDWEARGLVHQFVDVVRNGEDEGGLVTGEVLSLTGRAPTTFETFARANVEAFSRPRHRG